ncbi:hypothetical protein N7505_011915 [Penicillium chrysogenum]|uniref:Uncharacterized protein n=1 Tax=Penicillium chrysogenum TaxID=5076 RepID=A0ABQ8VZU9_PENCH|nr:hypothetical protein N7505_011915 [Penicillium chrysogenum]KAJ5268308.1 hypothetical protein N7524_005767 [Penicillium chrysogenum]
MKCEGRCGISVGDNGKKSANILKQRVMGCPTAFASRRSVKVSSRDCSLALLADQDMLYSTLNQVTPRRDTKKRPRGACCSHSQAPGGLSNAWPVAKAAEILSLPTSPAAALAIAVDKYKTSIAAGHPALLAHGKEEALQADNTH